MINYCNTVIHNIYIKMFVPKYGFKDTLIVPKYATSMINSRKEVNLIRNFNINGNSVNIVPIISSNMTVTGTFDHAKVMSENNCLTAIHKYYTIEQWKEFINGINRNENNGRNESNIKHNSRMQNESNKSASLKRVIDTTMITIGTSERDNIYLKSVMNLIPFKFICIDVANGYHNSFQQYCKKIRIEYPNAIIVAGNVCTPNATERLIQCGVDIVKVGVGSGSVCTTRVKTGVGVPQVSAVITCSTIAHRMGKYIISDGGHVVSGDISKSFCAGADFVMLGGMLAGHDESDGTLCNVDSNVNVNINSNINNIQDYTNTTSTKKQFYGESSFHAMKEHGIKHHNYRTEEGKVVVMECKGPLQRTITDILGGIRSTCAYIGAKNIEEMQCRSDLIHVFEQENRVYL